jgi:3-hydroxybutyryl-CoA dehydratase
MVFRETEFLHTFTVTSGIYNALIEVFNDNNPLHTDTEFAISKGFTGKVMHGNILNGFISYFVGECLPVKNVIIHCQDIKYMKPVYLNDMLTLHAVVDEIYESVNVVKFSFYFENSNGIKIAKGNIQIGVI